MKPITVLCYPSLLYFSKKDYTFKDWKFSKLLEIIPFSTGKFPSLHITNLTFIYLPFLGQCGEEKALNNNF